MKRNTLFLIWVTILVFFSEVVHSVTTTYAPTPNDFLSPERGFYTWLKSLESSTPADAAFIWNSGYTLAYARIRLDDYQTLEKLPSGFLTSLQAGFDSVRSAGIKVIPRPVYNYPDGEDDYRNAKDAPLNILLSHVRQIGEVYQSNEDVIYVIQGGFVGAWGEQHSSSNGNDESGPMLQIREAMDLHFPKSRSITWRYPNHVMEWNLALPDPGDTSRHGLYNDCFMSSDTDVGTYSDNVDERETQRAFAALNSASAPYGGETCNGDKPRTSCEDIQREGKEFHLSYFNNIYYKGFHDRWKTDLCYDDVRSEMGYRIYVQSASALAVANRGQTTEITIVFQNIGWSQIFNERKTEVLLSTDTTKYTLPINGLRNRVLADGQLESFTFQWDVPANAPTTEY